MIRRPPRSTLDRSSAASDVYKRQHLKGLVLDFRNDPGGFLDAAVAISTAFLPENVTVAVSYTHLRAHETVLDLVCRLLLEKKHQDKTNNQLSVTN